MTREERHIAVLNRMLESMDVYDSIQPTTERKKAIKAAIQALSQEPCEDIAQERYKDLCEYFGDAKDILKSREDFKAWLERVKWHIRKAEELYEKYEYKIEPCDDAISRDAVIELIERSVGNKSVTIDGFTFGKSLMLYHVKQLPSVTQKSGKWIYDRTRDWDGECKYECSECGMGSDVDYAYCMRCGAKMESEE